MKAKPKPRVFPDLAASEDATVKAPLGADDTDLLPDVDDCLADTAWLTPIPPAGHPALAPAS